MIIRHADKNLTSAQKDFDRLLENYKNVEKSIPTDFKPEELGLVQVNKETYQNGWFEYMNDSPKPILTALNNADIDVWFVVHPSQFYLEFDVYVRKEQYEQAIPILTNVNTYQGFDGAKRLKEALSNCKIYP